MFMLGGSHVTHLNIDNAVEFTYIHGLSYMSGHMLPKTIFHEGGPPDSLIVIVMD